MIGNFIPPLLNKLQIFTFLHASYLEKGKKEKENTSATDEGYLKEEKKAPVICFLILKALVNCGKRKKYNFYKESDYREKGIEWI